jgi:hypothetical protein
MRRTTGGHAILEKMKRWSILFWSALSSLVGMSWLARSFGVPLSALVSAALLGMIGACTVAFFAMIRKVPYKWPAAVALVLAGPMALEFIRTLPQIPDILHYFGFSFPFLLVLAGTAVTVVSAIVILAAQPPTPPPPPQVPSARVVD